MPSGPCGRAAKTGSDRNMHAHARTRLFDNSRSPKVCVVARRIRRPMVPNLHRSAKPRSRRPPTRPTGCRKLRPQQTRRVADQRLRGKGIIVIVRGFVGILPESCGPDLPRHGPNLSGSPVKPMKSGENCANYSKKIPTARPVHDQSMPRCDCASHGFRPGPSVAHIAADDDFANHAELPVFEGPEFVRVYGTGTYGRGHVKIAGVGNGRCINWRRANA